MNFFLLTLACRSLLISGSIPYGEIIHVGPLEISSGDIVTVHYKSQRPSSSDWIGAYSPENAFERPNASVPVHFYLDIITFKF